MIAQLLTLACLFALTPENPGSSMRGSVLHMIDGRRVDGQIIEIRPGSLRYRADGESHSIAVDDLERVELTKPVTPATSTRIFYLDNGSVLFGDLAISDQHSTGMVSVKLSCGLNTAAPLSAFAAIRLAKSTDTGGEKELSLRLANRSAGRDLLILIREGKPVVLPGVVEAMDAAIVALRVGDRLQTAKIDSVYAIVLGLTGQGAANNGITATLTDGSRLNGAISKADEENAFFECDGAGHLTIGWRQISDIQFQSARVTFVSDLQPITSDSHSVLASQWPVEINRNVMRGPLQLGGKVFAHGIGVHASNRIDYSLGRQFESFSATIGVDDAAAPHGSVIFRVKDGSRTLYESPRMIGGGKPLPITVKTAGLQTLTLECDDAGDLDLSDHGDWGDARLVRAKSPSR